MSKHKKTKKIPQRNLVAKHSRSFNKSSVEQSKKDKQKHKKPKHKNSGTDQE